MGIVFCNLIALFLAAIALYGSYVVGVFSIMSSGNNVQLILIALIPTALVPVLYFLLVHGLFANEAGHKILGIFCAIGVFIANFAILSLVFNIARSMELESEINFYIGAILALSVQFVLLVVIRAWLNSYVQSTQYNQSLKEGTPKIGAP